MGHQTNCNPATWHLDSCECGFREKVEEAVEQVDFNDGVRHGMGLQADRVHRLQLLLVELAGHVFEVDDSDQFIVKGNSTLPQRINLEAGPIMAGHAFGPRMIPVTAISTELDCANVSGIESAVQMVEDLKIDNADVPDFILTENTTEWYREKFRQAILDLLSLPME